MIVITGATGFVGEEVVKQAREAGYPVRAIVREPRRAQWLADRYGVELFHGNVLYGPSIEGAMTDAKCVVHLVGIIYEWKENTFERVHAQATRFVVDEAKRAGVKRFVHMSAGDARECAEPVSPDQVGRRRGRAKERDRVDDFPSVIHLRAERQGDQHAGGDCAARAVDSRSGQGRDEDPAHLG